MKKLKYVKLFENLQQSDQEPEDFETSNEYIELYKAGLVPNAVKIKVSTDYFIDDEELDYDQVGEEYSEEIANWTSSNGLKVIKGNIELNADGDNYYTTGSFSYEVMFSDRSVLKIETISQRNSEKVVTYSITKDGRTVDLRDIFHEYYEEGYADPIHNDFGKLVITQPLDFAIEHSGLF